MNQYLDMACPSCGKALRVRSEYIGQRVVCKQCSNSFKVEAPASPPAEDLRPHLDALRRELEGARADLAARDADLVTSARQLHEAQEALAQLRREQELALAAREGELAEARAEIAALRGTATEAAAELEGLRRQVGTLEEVQSQVADWRGERERLLRELDQAREEGQAAAALLEETDRQARQRDEAREQEHARASHAQAEALARTEADLAELRDQHERLREDWREARQRLDGVVRDENERDRLIAEREAARDKVSEVTRRWKEEAEAADRERGRSVELERSLAAAADELAALRQSLADAARVADERDRLEAILEATRTELEEMAAARDEQARRAEAYHEALGQSGKDWEAARGALQEELARHQRELAATRDEVNAWRERQHETARGWEALQEEQALRETARRQAEEHFALERQLWQTQLAQYLQGTEEARRLHQEAQRDAGASAERLGQLEAELEKARRREDELEEALTAARLELSQSREEKATADKRHELHAEVDKYGFEQMLALAQWEADQQRGGLEAELVDLRREVSMLRNVLQGMGVRV